MKDESTLKTIKRLLMFLLAQLAIGAIFKNKDKRKR
jgi:hypothetical protein